MRLAIVARKLARGDGQGRINYEIARYALARGHSVSVLTTTVEPDLVSAGANWIPVRPPVHRPDLIESCWFPRLADRHLGRCATEFDAIIGNGYTLRWPHQVNLCQFVHGTWLHSPMHVSRLTHGPYAWYQWLHTKLNALGEKRSFAQAKMVVAPSKLTRGELQQIGVPEHKICVIPNAVDLEEFHPGAQERAPLGLPKGVPLALFAGDIRTPRKNLDSVLRALTKTAGIHLAVIGRLEGSPFPRMATELGIGDRVHFMGFRPDTALIMRAVDLFVFPSRYDTFGLVVLEAMASSLPVITSAMTGASELMSNSCGIVLQDPEDTDQLAAGLQQYMADAELRRQAGQAGREIATGCSWASMAERYLKLLS